MPEFIKTDSVFSTQKKNFASTLLDPKNARIREKLSVPNTPQITPKNEEMQHKFEGRIILIINKI